MSIEPRFYRNVHNGFIWHHHHNHHQATDYPLFQCTRNPFSNPILSHMLCSSLNRESRYNIFVLLTLLTAFLAFNYSLLLWLCIFHFPQWNSTSQTIFLFRITWCKMNKSTYTQKRRKGGEVERERIEAHSEAMRNGLHVINETNHFVYLYSGMNWTLYVMCSRFLRFWH